MKKHFTVTLTKFGKATVEDLQGFTKECYELLKEEDSE